LSQVLNNNKHVEEFLFKTPLVDTFHTRKKHSHLALKKLKVSSKLIRKYKKRKGIFFSTKISLTFEKLRKAQNGGSTCIHSF
jgi:hypothetical protein